MNRDKHILYIVLVLWLSATLTLYARFGRRLCVQPWYAESSLEQNQGIALQNRDPRAHCCNRTTNVSLDELCGSESIINEDRNGDGKYEDISMAANLTQECTCLDFFYCKLVVVTAFSSNHYEEAQDMIASVQLFLPNTKLIVYDLGMTDEQRNDVSGYCNVELREFHFEKYPPHTKDLMKYAWKPLLVDEVSQQYEVIFYGDASVRVMASLDSVLPLLWRRFPLVGRQVSQNPIISMTHDGMLHYLNITLSRKEMVHFRHIQGGCWVMWVNSLMREKLLDYWVDCALHEECIAPPGTMKYCSKTQLSMAKSYGGVNTGCHRYDQSALALILIREFGLKVEESIAVAVSSPVLVTVRKLTHLYEVVRECTF